MTQPRNKSRVCPACGSPLEPSSPLPSPSPPAPRRIRERKTKVLRPSTTKTPGSLGELAEWVSAAASEIQLARSASERREAINRMLDIMLATRLSLGKLAEAALDCRTGEQRLLAELQRVILDELDASGEWRAPTQLGLEADAGYLDIRRVLESLYQAGRIERREPTADEAEAVYPFRFEMRYRRKGAGHECEG